MIKNFDNTTKNGKIIDKSVINMQNEQVVRIGHIDGKLRNDFFINSENI